MVSNLLRVALAFVLGLILALPVSSSERFTALPGTILIKAGIEFNQYDILGDIPWVGASAMTAAGMSSAISNSGQ